MKKLLLTILMIAFSLKTSFAYIPKTHDFNFKNSATGNFILHVDGSLYLRSFELLEDFVEVCYKGEITSAANFLEENVQNNKISAEESFSFFLDRDGTSILALDEKGEIYLEISECWDSE